MYRYVNANPIAAAWLACGSAGCCQRELAVHVRRSLLDGVIRQNKNATRLHAFGPGTSRVKAAGAVIPEVSAPVPGHFSRVGRGAQIFFDGRSLEETLLACIPYHST
jgi:hypothetical protein